MASAHHRTSNEELMTMPDAALDESRREAGLSHPEFWLRYFALGGTSAPLEGEGYLCGGQAARAPRHRRARRLRRTTAAPITKAARTAAPSSHAMSLTSSVLTLWRARIELAVAIAVMTAGSPR